MNQETRSILIEKRGYRKDVAGDTLLLYLSNHPIAARWLAQRLGERTDEVLLELCCAVGITLEQLAPLFQKSIGVDIDKGALEACKQNLLKAGLMDRAQLIQGDVRRVDVLKQLKADVVIYDIPYWYPQNYSHYSEEERDVTNPDLLELVTNIRKFISENIIIFAPREMSYEYFRELLGECEYQKIYIDQKHGRSFIFFGNLIKERKEGEVFLTS